jgi:cytochrome b561
MILMLASRDYSRIEPRSNHPRPLHYVAKTMHGSIYLFFFLMPLTGAAAWFHTWELAADAHELLQVGLLAAIGLHISGALFQHLILRSNVLRKEAEQLRMLRKACPS